MKYFDESNEIGQRVDKQDRRQANTRRQHTRIKHKIQIDHNYKLLRNN